MSIAERIQIFTARESAIKGRHAYTWHHYHGKTRIIRSRKGYEVALSKGDHFGLRPAKTDPNKVRLIHRRTGPTKVFSLSKNLATRLQRHSRPYSRAVR